MSNYRLEVGDDQVEDGEMESPTGDSPMQLSKDNAMFSMSDEENEDTADSLDIKPPQAKSYHARVSQPSSRSGNSRREKHGDRGESRREHSSSHGHSSKGGESSVHYSSRKGHHRSRSDHRDRRNEGHEKKHSHRERREAAGRGAAEAARLQEIAADHKLDDLRKRLLDKRKRGETSRHGEKRLDFPPDLRDSRDQRTESRSDREIRKDRSGESKEMRMERTAVWTEDAEHREFRDAPRHESRRVEERKVESSEHKRSEEHRERRERAAIIDKAAERSEGAPRKEFLLEANRQKEIYRRELEARRERRNLEKEKERTMREIVRKRERSRSRQRKKMKSEEPEEEPEPAAETGMDVVDVSDDSSATDEAVEEEEEEEDESTDSEDDETDSKTDTDNQAAADTDDSPGGDTDEEKATTSRAPSVSDDDTDSFAEQRQEEGKNGSSPGEPTEIPEEEEEEMEEELPPYLPAVSGCRSVEEFQCLNRIEEGTYGVVYRARDRSNDEVVALKRLKMEKEKEGFPITSLREINTLLKAQHLNIVTVREIVVGSNMDKIFIVMDYVEHDLKSLMETMKQKKQVFIPGEVKCLMQQLLRAVSHLHDNWILHRDLKTSNLLLSHKGILKVGDFGLAREYGSPLKAYTPIVVTLWYRSPELLLCTKEYSTPIDMWSVGCIFGEFLSMEALFPGKSEVDQINRIFKDLGTPTEKVWPEYRSLPAVQKMNFTTYPGGQLRKRFATMVTELGLDLFYKFLTYEPESRVTADDALKHGYFDESPLAIDPAMFPTWPAKSELGHRKPAGQASPKPPPGGAGYQQLGDTDDRVPDAEGFHMGVTENRRIAMGAGFSLKF